MPCAEGVVLAFGAFQEAGQSAFSADRRKFIAAARENFVNIALMSDVPDDAVFGGVVDVVQRSSEFDDAQRRGQVPADSVDGVPQVAAQFRAQEFQFIRTKFAQILGGIYTGEQRELLLVESTHELAPRGSRIEGADAF